MNLGLVTVRLLGSGMCPYTMHVKTYRNAYTPTPTDADAHTHLWKGGFVSLGLRGGVAAGGVCLRKDSFCTGDLGHYPDLAVSYSAASRISRP